MRYPPCGCTFMVGGESRSVREWEWIDVSQWWAECQAHHLAISNMRKTGHTPHRAGKDHDTIGAAGEIVYALATGQPLPTLGAHVGGSPGADFEDGYDIKAAGFEQPTYSLIVYEERALPSVGYALVVVDTKRQRGAVVGRIGVQKFRSIARRRDFGFGVRLFVDWKELDAFSSSGAITRS